MNFKKVRIDNINYQKIIYPWIGKVLNQKARANKNFIINNYSKIKNFLLPPLISSKNHHDIIVIGIKQYLQLPKKIKKKSHIILKPRDLLDNKIEIIKNLRKITFDLLIYKKIYNNLIEKKNLKYDYIKNIIQEINPRILIITSTLDPVQRLWAYYARETSVKVICIQHGIFSNRSGSKALEEDIIDYYISISKEQSKIIQKIIPKKKHILLHKKNFFIYKFPKKININICLVGNDYENYGRNGIIFKEKILKIYISLIKLLYSQNLKKFKIYYKKHPSEKLLDSIINKVSFINSKNLNSIDIFFGVSSTLLFNLASKKKCTIQLYSRILKIDNYEKNSFCKTINIDIIKKKGFFNLFPENGLRIPYLKKKNLYTILNNIIIDKK